MLYSAFGPEIFGQLNWEEGSGIYWEISDKLRKKFFGGPKASKNADYQQDQLAEAWRDTNYYSYNLRYPKPVTRAEALKIMQKDLNAFFGAYLNLEARIENRPKQALVLGVLKDKETAERLLATKGGITSVDYGAKSGFYQLNNAPLSSLGGWLKKTHPNIVFMDKTGINLKADVKLPNTILDNTELASKELAKYGLTLQIEEMLLPVLAVKEGRAK